ncbi:hypothetical protein VE01_02066 [Pseudogymnoascus verrucosus]|uniref:Uncharacterized protein n=1 Tax=Pseudogymnoascus verrucosus TaxID=342668 RepID=A0A1B8GV85_9PEZI|nr:uncharacterized protein VE01_02066 [Pseudogymnoascus verrucosus]OBT99710.1 hypothetical protein VE01_02066 [Pseudogymnoascus verrucosus]
MGPSKKHKQNLSASSNTPLAGNSISGAAAELSRIHSLAQPPDIPTAADQDLNLSARQQRDRSLDSHSQNHHHHHHRHRHAARQALSSLLHESGTSGHFGLGLGIHRRNFGLDLDVDGKKNEGGEASGATPGTEMLKQLVRDVPRQIASEVPKQIGRYLDGRGEVRDEVAVGVGVKTRGTEVGVRVEGAKGWWRGGRGESASQVEAAPPPAPAPQPEAAPPAAPASEAALAPRQPLAVDKSATLQLAKRYSCHICRFINEEIERCASCGHRLCIDCEWLLPIAKTDGAAQEFAIYEDSDAMEARDMEMEDRRRTENIYTPSEFEQENYVDPDTPDLPPNVWARQAALAKAHYTTPQSPTDGSPYYTTTQSPTIRSPPPSPVDLSHLSASDYPEPLRLAPSPVRPPGPRSRRVVRDNPFVVADQLSAHHGRVMRVDSEAGIRSRDGQASPQPGRYSARARALARRMEERDEDRRTWLANKSRGEQPSPQPGRYSARTLASREREEDKRDSQRRMWQTNRVPLPGFGAEREGARRASRGEKVSAVERAPRPKKFDPVMSGTLTPSESKAGGGNVVEEGGVHALPVPDGGKNGDEKGYKKQDGSEG